MHTRGLTIFLFSLLLIASGKLGDKLLIDNFAETTSPFIVISDSNFPATYSNSEITSSALGGERDTLFILTSGNPDQVYTSNIATSGFFSISFALETIGSAVVRYDGANGTGPIDETGLGELNLLDNGADAFSFIIRNEVDFITATITVYSSEGASEGFIELEAIIADADYLIRFSDFVGTANFGAIGAIELSFNVDTNSVLDIGLKKFRTVASVVAPTTVTATTTISLSPTVTPSFLDNTSTSTDTPTTTISPSSTVSSSSSSTDTSTITPTTTISSSSTPTSTSSISDTPTTTISSSSTISQSPTPTMDPTASSTPTTTRSQNPSGPSTTTNTPSPTRTVNPSGSSTSTVTGTANESDSSTPTQTITAIPSRTTTKTGSSTPTRTTLSTTPSIISQTRTPALATSASSSPAPVVSVVVSADVAEVVVELTDVGVLVIAEPLVFGINSTLTVSRVTRILPDAIAVVSPAIDIKLFDVNGNLIQPNGNVVICFPLVGGDLARYCLAHLDEILDKWICDNNDVEERNGKSCSSTPHFTIFALIDIIILEGISGSSSSISIISLSTVNDYSSFTYSNPSTISESFSSLTPETLSSNPFSSLETEISSSSNASSLTVGVSFVIFIVQLLL